MQPFGPFLPDSASFNPAAAVIAKNVIPALESYRPVKSFGAVSNALPARPKGAFSAREVTAQQIYNFAGTGEKLFKLSETGLAWSDVSRASGGNYSTLPEGFWTFSQFGNYIIAANGADAVQYYELGGSTVFAALAGSPPIAKFSAVVRDFVVLGGLDSNQNRVQWSGINAPDDYVPSMATMSDYQDFPEGGRVMGIAGGDVGIVFCERAIWRMAFEGPPVVFRFDKIATSLGCRAPQSIASYEGLTFFLSNDGVYMIRGASELTPIGSEKVDRWLRDRMDPSKLNLVTGSIDPENKLYLMGFVSRGSEEPDTILVYHWPTGKFAYIEQDHIQLYSAFRQEGLTIDGLDTVAATIDELPFTMDSMFYSSVGQYSLSAFGATYRMGFFEGSNMEAAVETGFVQLAPGRKAMLRGLRPIVEGAFNAPSVIVRSRNHANETATENVASSASPNGFCNTRVNARYHSARVVVPSSSEWTHMVGVDDLKFSAMGAR